MLKNNITKEMIKECTGLNDKEIEKIAQTI